MTTQLFLVRHGESEWNQLSRYAGQRDVPLSALGKQQALRLAGHLDAEVITAIYSGPLQRARDTAAAIGERKHLPVVLEPRLVEINHGLWEGLTMLQVGPRFPIEYVRWRTQPHRAKMPQGESLADVARRAKQVLADILAKHPEGKIILCSHDALLRVLLLTSLGLTLEHFWKWRFANASLSVLEAYPDGDSVAFCLTRLNETIHLKGVHSQDALQAL